MASLLRALRTHHELVYSSSDARLSRRALLAGSTAAGLTAACGGGSPPQPAASPPATPTAARKKAHSRIGIVGAGLAGLNCAYQLKKRGLEASVYEASSRVGGRCFTDRETFAPQHCELGGELIDTGHTAIRELAAELGLELLDYSKDDPSLGVRGFFDHELFGEKEILEDFAPFAAAVETSLEQLKDPDGDIGYRDMNGAEALDRISISQWLDANELSGRVRRLLEVAYLIEYGLELDVSNALNLVWMLGTNLKKFEVFGESDERFHVARGNDALVSGLASRLDDGQVQLSSPLEALRELSDGRFELQVGRSTVKLDHVVLTLPFTQLRKLDLKLSKALPPAKARAIAELSYGNNTKLMCGFRSKPWREAKASGETYTDLGYQCSWDTSRLQPGSSGILTSFTGGKTATAAGLGEADARAKAFLGQLDQVFPGAQANSSGATARFAWGTHRYTEGSYSSYSVGQYSAFAGAEGERVRNLHFAGEHTSTEAQGYLEGAVASGARAAAEIAS